MYLDEQSAGGSNIPKTPVTFRAAEYVRMSTEHQQYSTENQADKIREYAQRRGIEIVRTYADAGKSGLSIDGRQALQQLSSNYRPSSTEVPSMVGQGGGPIPVCFAANWHWRSGNFRGDGQCWHCARGVVCADAVYPGGARDDPVPLEA